MHTAQLSWTLNTPDFSYDSYNREHTWTFDNGLSIEASAAPEFMGKSGIDPEEALVAALSSCHMLTFLAICAKKKLTVLSYTDSPSGVLEKNSNGKMCVTKITLSPKVVFESSLSVSSETLKKLHDSAHDNCFIAHSYSGRVDIL